METREVLLQDLNETIGQFLAVYGSLAEPDRVIGDDWSAKDILGHITFWHESFARNVQDLVNTVTPRPLKGRFIDLNQAGVAEMRQQSGAQVLDRLSSAHSVIQANILNRRLGLIPYKQGSRAYSPEEHLEIVNGHIKAHLCAIKGSPD